MKRIVLMLPILVFVFLSAFIGCKDSTTDKPSPVDAAFIGAWYCNDPVIGFEVSKQGVSTTLTVDSDGKLQYASQVTGSPDITLTLTKAKEGIVNASIVVKIDDRDSLMQIYGTYTFNSRGDTVTFKTNDPMHNYGTWTTIFRRASIGEVVRSMAMFQMDLPKVNLIFLCSLRKVCQDMPLRSV